MSLFEIFTMFCFGLSWPFSIHKTYCSKSAKGKSFVFLSLVLLGYASGVLHKVYYTPGDWVVWLWALNGTMVATDLALALNYRRREAA